MINPNTVARAYTESVPRRVAQQSAGRGVFVAVPKDELTKDARRRRLLESLDRFLTKPYTWGFLRKKCLGWYLRGRGNFNGIGEGGLEIARKEPLLTHVIVTERLTKFYGPRCVVNGEPARAGWKCLRLSGENAPGKSTTIKMLLGVVQPELRAD